MKIHRIYNGKNALSDISGDIVKITMSVELWNLVKDTIWQAKFKNLPEMIDERQARRLEIIFNEAERNQTTEWKD